MYFVKAQKLALKQGDRRTFTATITDHTETPVDLTNATVKFIFANNKSVILNKPATVTDAPKGVVSFSFQEEDITGHGQFEGELHVEFPNGDEFTAPTMGYLEITINQHLLSRGSETLPPSLYDQIMADMHSHTNKGALDRLGVSGGNNLTIDGVEKLGGGSSQLGNLTDVHIASTPTNGYVLKYNSTNVRWEPAPDLTGGASGTLNDLTDVSISSPSNGSILKYNSTSGNWEVGVDVSGTGTADYATIEDYGAVANDSTKAAANTTAIQNAVNENSYIVFPAKTYYIDASIVVNSGKTLQGRSMKYTKLMMVANKDIPVLDVQTGFNVNILDMEIAYDDWTPTGKTNRNAILLGDQFAHSTIKNIRFNSVYRAIYLRQVSGDNMFSNNFENLYCFWYAKNFIHLAPASGGNTGCVFSNLYCNNGLRNNRLSAVVTPFYFHELTESVMMQLNAEWSDIDSAFHFDYCRNVTLISPHVEGVNMKTADRGLFKVEGIPASPTQKGSLKILSCDLYDVASDATGTAVFEVKNNGVIKCDGLVEQATTGTMKLIHSYSGAHYDNLYLDDIRVGYTNVTPPVVNNPDGIPKLRRLNDSVKYFTMPGGDGEYKISVSGGSVIATKI